MNITGKEIAYLYICRRKLWLFRCGLRPELENDNVRLGMRLNQTAFPREEKDIPIGEVGVIDWAAFKHGVIHEIKKGRAPGKGDEAQVRYYLWWLNGHGIPAAQAIIHYPKIKKMHPVPWNETAAALAEQDIAAVQTVLAEPSPPPVVHRPYCKSCAYQEICYS